MNLGFRTRRKLAEAKFFLRHINEVVRRGGPGTPPELEYYVSAFISAARSVGWIMKAEYGALPGWEEWRSNYPSSQDEEAILDRTNELRIQDQKKDPLRPRLVPLVVPVFDPAYDTPPRIEPGLGEVYGPSYYRVFWFLTIDNGRELLSTCSRYVKWLEKLVECCETHFATLARS